MWLRRSCLAWILLAWLLFPGSALAEVRVARLPDGAITPDAEIDADGVIHVAYVRDNNAYYVHSHDDGRSFSSPMRINHEDDFVYAGGFRGPDLAVGREGQVHIVWYNAGYQQKRPKEQWGVMYARMKADKSGFEKERNLNRRPSDNFSLAVDRQGHVAVVWMAEGLYVTLSRNNGDFFAPAITMPADPCECCSSRALLSDTGQLYIAYREKAANLRDMHLLVQSVSSRDVFRSKTSEDSWHIDACPMTGNFLAFSSDGMVAGWETKGQVFFGHLAHDGKLKQPGEQLAAAKGQYPVALSHGDTTLVAWKHDQHLEWHLFDTRGQKAASLERHQAGQMHRPSGVITRTGDYLLFP